MLFMDLYTYVYFCGLSVPLIVLIALVYPRVSMTCGHGHLASGVLWPCIAQPFQIPCSYLSLSFAGCRLSIGLTLQWATLRKRARDSLSVFNLAASPAPNLVCFVLL